MRHWIKRFITSKLLLGILSLLIITFIGGVLFIRSAAFMEWVKHRVAAEIRNRIDAGYTVVLGDMTGNLLTGVKIADVAVFKSGGTRDEAVLSLQHLVLKYHLLALLHRRVEVTALEIYRPQVQAEVDATGTLNLTQLLSPVGLTENGSAASRRSGPRATDTAGSQWTVAVQRVRCSDGTLRFIDAQRNLSLAMAGLSLDIQGPLNTWNHQGTFSISDGHVAFNGAETAITLFEADVQIVASGGELRQLRLNVGNDSVLEMTGHTDENLSWHTDIDVRIDAADIQPFWQTIWQKKKTLGNEGGIHPSPALHGIAALHLTAEGTPERVSGTLTANVPSLTVAGLSSPFTPTGGALHLRDVAIDAAFSTHPVPTLALNRLHMHIAEGILQASATLTSEVYEGAWHATDVQLASIPPMEPFRSWKGHVSTTGNFSGKGTDASKLRLDGILELTDASLNGVAIADSTLACTVAPPVGNVVIDNVNDGDTERDDIAQTNLIERLANDKKPPPVGAVSNRAQLSNEINVFGTLAEADVHLGGQLGEALRLHATAVRIDKLMDIFGGAPLNGRGEMTAAISTTGTMAGTLDIRDATFIDIPIGVLAGDFRYEAGQVFVENGRLTKGASRIAIEGTVDMEGALPAMFRVVAQPFQVADYRHLLFGTPDYDVSGRVTGELFCDGSLAQLDGRGMFAVTDGYAWGIRLDELTLPLAIEDYALTIPDFQISARGQQVVLNLVIAASGDVNMDIRSPVPVQLAELMHAADVPDFPIDANIDIVAIATQPSKPPLPSARGNVVIDNVTDGTTERHVIAKTPVIKRLANLDRLAGAEVVGERIDRQTTQRKVNVDITLADITYQGNPITDATLHGTLVQRQNTSGEPDIFEFVGEAFDGTSHITGQISTATDSPYHFTVQSRAMPATPILRCLHPMLEAVTGTADSTVDITGTLAALSPKASKNEAGLTGLTGLTGFNGAWSYENVETDNVGFGLRKDTLASPDTLSERLANDRKANDRRARIYPYDVDIVIQKTVLRYRDIPITNREPIRLQLLNDVWTFTNVALMTASRAVPAPSPFVELTGTFSAQGEVMQLKAASPGFALEPLSTVLGIPIDGTARYEMSLNGTVTAPELALELTVPALRMQTEFGDIDVDVRARVSYQDNAVQIEPSLLHIHGDALDIVGDIDVIYRTSSPDIGTRLNVNLRSPQLNLANYAPFLQSRLTPEMAALLMDEETEEWVTGTLDVSIDVTGSLAEPSIAIQAGSREPLCIGKFPQPIVLDALQASVALTPETVHITDVHTNFSLGDATYQARGTATFPLTPNKTPQFALTASANQLQVAHFAPLFLQQTERESADTVTPLSPAIHGTLSAEVEVIGTGLSPEQFAATCEVTALSVTAGTLYFSLPQRKTRRAALTVASRYGTLEGTLAFDIASPLLAGTVNAAIGGTHAAPDITVTGLGTLHHLKWRGTVDYRDEHIAVHRIELASREGKTLTLSGRIPYTYRSPNANVVIDNVNDGDTSTIDIPQTNLSERLANDRKSERLANDRKSERLANDRKNPKTRKMEMHLRGHELPLAFFPKVAAIFSEHAGVVDIDINIVGTPRAPQLSGSVSLEAPHLRLKNFPEPIRNATLHIKAGEDGLDVTQFGFEVADTGECTLSHASLALDGLMPKAFTLDGLRVRQFPLGALAQQVVPPGLLADIRGHVTATLAECRMPLDNFFTPGRRSVPSLTALFEVATASAEIEDVHFAFSTLRTDRFSEPLSRYDFRNTEPVQLVLAEGRARLLQEFLIKDFSYLREQFGADFLAVGSNLRDIPVFQIAGDFSQQLNRGQLPPALHTRLQERAPMDTYTLTKQEALFLVSGSDADTNPRHFWLWQRVPEQKETQKQTKGRMQILEAAPTLGIDREASFALKADFSQQLEAGTMPAELRSHLASKALPLPQTPCVFKVARFWQVQDAATQHRWVVRQDKAAVSVFQQSLQFSVDKGSALAGLRCAVETDIVVRVKNVDISPLTRDWPTGSRLKGTLSGSLHISATADGAPQITLRRKKPSTRTQPDGIHLNGVPLEINGRLRYREGVWAMSKKRPLTLSLGSEENRLTSTLRIETASRLQSLPFWQQLREAIATLRTGTLTGVLNLQAKALEILPVLVPAVVSDARGDIELYAALTGTPDTPQIDGKVTFKNLALAHEAAGISLTDAAGECQLSNSLLAITRGAGTLNGGDFTLTGGVFLWTSDERLWHPTEPVLALEATLAEATFAQPGQYQFHLTSARLALDGQLSAPLLTGAVVLGAGESRQHWDNVRAWFAGTSVTATDILLDASLLRELQLDIALTAPSLYLFSTVTGPTDIHFACTGTLTGIVQAPIFKGDVRILDGRVSLFTQQYRIVDGSYISNESTTAFNPVLDIRLKTVTPLRAVPLRDGTTADMNILIAYTGKLSNVDYTLRAEPLNATTTELPTQEELLALLTQRVALPFGGVTFRFEPYSRHISVEYRLPRQMLLKFERDGEEGYGVDFQMEGRF